MSEAVESPKIENRILAALPAEDYQRLSSHLEPMVLHHSQVLYRAGDVMDYGYFPSKSMVSLCAGYKESCASSETLNVINPFFNKAERSNE
jgi:CRP-like cAMP-binding protein